MSDKTSKRLETYLEEIGHFLSGRAEREEILTEIRSHLLEKAEREPGGASAETLERVIAAYGPARRVAERYLDGRPIIAPFYRRHLFRYTSILFAYHALLTAAGVIFKQGFIFFPFLFIPRLGVIEALIYLPTAFLADLGLVALVLYLITQSGKEVRLPWPRFAVDLDEVKRPAKSFWGRVGAAVGAVIMFAITNQAVRVFGRFNTIFVTSLDPDRARPLFNPGAGYRISLIVIAMLAVSTVSLAARIITRSRWLDVASNAVYLALVGLLLGQPFDSLFAVNLPERLLPMIKLGLMITLFAIALAAAADLVKNVAPLVRRKMAAGGGGKNGAR
jgi:hypothetical protein